MNSIVVHYKELALKGRNRWWFIQHLVRNLTRLEDQEAFSRILLGNARDLMDEFELAPQTQALIAPLAVVGGQVAPSTPGTPFNLTYTPNSANAVSQQISATYRGANEYRPNRVKGVPLTERVKLSSGYIQYVNYSALALPATRNASGTLLSPFGSESRNHEASKPAVSTLRNPSRDEGRHWISQQVAARGAE